MGENLDAMSLVSRPSQEVELKRFFLNIQEVDDRRYKALLVSYCCAISGSKNKSSARDGAAAKRPCATAMVARNGVNIAQIAGQMSLMEKKEG